VELLKTLTERHSSPVLTEPAPTQEQLDIMFKAALRAPDHARLHPWRFIVIANDARKKLGDVFANIAMQDNPDLPESSIQRTRNLPLRAPLLVALVLHYKEHAMVPEVEQILSTGAAGYGLITAAFHLGVGAYWRTGAHCFDQRTAKALHLHNNEKLMGFIYLGTPAKSANPVPPLSADDFVTSWSG